MANEFHIRVIKLAKYEELRPAAYGVYCLSPKPTSSQPDITQKILNI